MHVIILAAGKGSRMRSRYPKVLQLLGGRPLLEHVLDTAARLKPEAIHVVVGHRAEAVRKQFQDREILWVEQSRQLGTGHAVAQAMDGVPEHTRILVLYGDMPLCRQEDLVLLLEAGRDRLAVLGMELEDPSGYGRLLCDGDHLQAIVEERDADGHQKTIRRVNSGIMAGPDSVFRQCTRLEANNRQGEHYLTDLVAMERAQNRSVALMMSADADSCLGCNSALDLEQLERVYQRRVVTGLLKQGVRMRDASRVDIRGQVYFGHDVELDCNVILEGRCVLGHGVRIGPGCVLRNVNLAAGVRVEAYSFLEDCRVDVQCVIGPFARIRPGTILAPHCRVGNFVEVKNSRIGQGSKINHLSYVGDTHMGAQVNVGAGTITCNYDGASKHVTEIGDDVFIGSNSALVAPLVLGDGSTVGAGSTITQDVAPGALAVERTVTRVVNHWKRPRKPRH